MMKRFLALVLCLCMTLTLLPTTAFAAVSDSLATHPRKIRRFWSSSPP